MASAGARVYGSGAEPPLGSRAKPLVWGEGVKSPQAADSFTVQYVA